jgi:hypothetical protein
MKHHNGAMVSEVEMIGPKYPSESDLFEDLIDGIYWDPSDALDGDKAPETVPENEGEIGEDE